jgi:hypothetical protein
MPQGTKQNSTKMTIDFHRLGLELLQFQLLNNSFLSPNLLPFDVLITTQTTKHPKLHPH